MVTVDRPIPVRFYAELSGKEPVREWLLSLNNEIRKKIGQDIKVVQFRWPVGMPLVRSLKSGLWEIRSNVKDGISRIIFMFEDQTIVLLHGFIKKTQKTPPQEIELALVRARAYMIRKEQ